MSSWCEVNVDIADTTNGQRWNSNASKLGKEDTSDITTPGFIRERLKRANFLGYTMAVGF